MGEGEIFGVMVVDYNTQGLNILAHRIGSFTSLYGSKILHM